MNFIAEVAEWFGRAENWSGAAGVPNRLLEHLAISGVALGIALAVALPVGFVLGHTGRGGLVAINVSNAGRAIPSFALLVLTVQVTGIGRTPAIVALVALAVPPVITNTYVGMRAVDADLREAAHGMGMTGWQQLRRIEAPLALPLVMAGVRTSTVQVIATATLAAVVASGGLGRFIVDGFASNDYVEVFAGALLVGALCIGVEAAFGGVQLWLDRRRHRPPGTDDVANPSAALPGMAAP